MSSHSFTLGYTATDTAMLDLDNTTFSMVRYWARRALYWHNLEGFLILKSSERHYHVIFNRSVSWSENLRIVAWASYVICPLLRESQSSERAQVSLNLLLWLRMQCIKEASTLRVSPKGEKPSPRIVYREGSQDDQIAKYLEYRKLIKNIIKKVTSRERRR